MSLAPPFELETERQLLGALLVRSTLIPEIEAQIKLDDFYLEAHRQIYNTLLTQNRIGSIEVEPVQISQRLQDLNQLEQVGGANYILSLAQDVIAPGNALRYAQRLKSLSMRRHLMEASNKIITEASGPVENEIEFLRNVENKILSITNQGFGTGIVSTAQIKTEFNSHIQGLLESRGQINGIQTHFRDFDQISSGLKGGELLVLAARPGLGKTTFALNVAANVAINDKQPVLVYSLEMSKIELMMRLVCAKSLIPHDFLKRGQIPANRQKDLQLSIDEICEAPLYIDDSGDLTIWECLARTRKFKIELEQQGKKLGLVVVDYLQLMNDPEARRLGRQHEVATISRSLKQLARMAQVPVIAVSQMNRSVEQRRGEAGRPQLSDLRESGAIEQDADMVMFIHHDYKEPQPGDSFNESMAQQNDDASKKGTVEMIIAKHRNGPVGNFRLIFRPHCNQFDNSVEISAVPFDGP